MIEETIVAPIRNPTEEILREANTRLGDPMGNRHNGSGKPEFSSPPDFETFVNEDDEDSDVFMTEVDYTQSTDRYTIP